MTDQERQKHANEANELATHPLVDAVADELAFNLGVHRKGLVAYGFAKLIGAVAQVVLARERGIDPQELVMSDVEAAEETKKLVQAFAAAGKPIIIITEEEFRGGSVADATDEVTDEDVMRLLLYVASAAQHLADLPSVMRSGAPRGAADMLRTVSRDLTSANRIVEAMLRGVDAIEDAGDEQSATRGDADDD